MSYRVCQLVLFINWSTAGFVPDFLAQKENICMMEGACDLLRVILSMIDTLVPRRSVAILRPFTSSFRGVFAFDMSAYRLKYCARFLDAVYTYINDFCM